MATAITANGGAGRFLQASAPETGWTPGTGAPEVNPAVVGCTARAGTGVSSNMHQQQQPWQLGSLPSRPQQPWHQAPALQLMQQQPLQQQQQQQQLLLSPLAFAQRQPCHPQTQQQQLPSSQQQQQQHSVEQQPFLPCSLQPVAPPSYPSSGYRVELPSLAELMSATAQPGSSCPSPAFSECSAPGLPGSPCCLSGLSGLSGLSDAELGPLPDLEELLPDLLEAADSAVADGADGTGQAAAAAAAAAEQPPKMVLYCGDAEAAVPSPAAAPAPAAAPLSAYVAGTKRALEKVDEAVLASSGPGPLQQGRQRVPAGPPAGVAGAASAAKIRQKNRKRQRQLRQQQQLQLQQLVPPSLVSRGPLPGSSPGERFSSASSSSFHAIRPLRSLPSAAVMVRGRVSGRAPEVSALQLGLMLAQEQFVELRGVLYEMQARLDQLVGQGQL